MEMALTKINYLYSASAQTDKTQTRDIENLFKKWAEQHRILTAIKERDAKADADHDQILQRMKVMDGRIGTILQRVISAERRLDINDKRHLGMDLMRLKGHGQGQAAYLGHSNLKPNTPCMNCKPKGVGK